MVKTNSSGLETYGRIARQLVSFSSQFSALMYIISSLPLGNIELSQLSGIQQCIQSALNDSDEATQAKWSHGDISYISPPNIIKNVPQQTDSSSCGLFTLKFIEFWNGNEFSADFSQVINDL
jgi:Ulp1 protease family, C-terminal catalytic domain